MATSTIFRTVARTLLICALFTAAWATVLTVLLVANNPTELGLLGAAELYVVLFVACLVPNAAGTAALATLWPALRRIRPGWFQGHWTAYLVSGLVAVNAVWVLYNRFSMVQQWASVRSFMTWSGIVQNALLVLVAAAIVLGGVRTRGGRSAIAAVIVAWGFAIAATAVALAWNGHDERYHRRFDLDEVRAAARAPGPHDPPKAPPGDSTRVIVVGIDGMDWNVALPLMRHGSMPNLAALVRQGAIGYLDNDDLSLSPNIWYTIFTGRPARDHEIHGFARLELPLTGKRISDLLVHPPTIDTFYGVRHLLERLGRIAPWEISLTNANDRRVATLWEVASDHDRRVVVANVLLNVPVREVNGAMLRMDVRPELKTPTVHPPELVETWDPILPSEPVCDTEDVFVEMTRAMEQEVGFTIDLLRDRGADLGVYYTHYLDTVAHSNWFFYNRDDFLLTDLPWSWSDEEWMEMVVSNREDRLFRSYTHVDETLGKFAAAFPDAVLIVVSDHGWTYSGYKHFGSQEGVVILSGPSIAPGSNLAQPHILDVTPTALALLGVPLSRELRGAVLSEALSADLPTTLVERYGAPGPARDDRPEIELDEAEIERLKALGYVN